MMYSDDEEMPDSMNDPYDDQFLLDDSELRKYCKANSLPYSLITLDELNSTSNLTSLPINTFVHTGKTSSGLNNGITNHWLFLTGNHIFDSYGKYEDYKVPAGIQYIDTDPDQLQAYDSVVCGMYCCLFYELVHNELSEHAPEEYGDIFVRKYNLTKNRKLNDSKILAIFDESVDFI